MSFHVIESRCRGGSSVRSIRSEEVAAKYFLDRVALALDTWQDESREVHITNLVLTKIDGRIDTVASIDFRCVHQAAGRKRRAHARAN